MPQMAPLYWSIMFVGVWFMLVVSCCLVWWVLSASEYHFNYKV